jgi:hypothetical protein
VTTLPRRPAGARKELPENVSIYIDLCRAIGLQMTDEVSALQDRGTAKRQKLSCKEVEYVYDLVGQKKPLL